MIIYKAGDIFQENVQALVNPVNCVGIMGAGLALQFKKKFPENFKAYEKVCSQDEMRPGKMFVFRQMDHEPEFIINFPTKRHWRDKSRMEDIDSGLAALADIVRQCDIHSIAVPPLGCGLGGLTWHMVREKIEKTMKSCPSTQCLVFEPTADYSMTISTSPSSVSR